MKIKIISFTKTGYELSEQVKEKCPAYEIELIYKGKSVSGRPEKSDIPLHEICRKAFEEKEGLLFIGAMGIAVRHIAPFVKDKLSDPPVLVMDERGIHVVPLLSGHVGGANELAFEIAEKIGADPVITTATDLEKAFSVDLFAKENGLEIVNRDGIAKVSVKALEGKPVILSIKDYPPEGPVDVIITDEEDRFGQGTIALRPPLHADETKRQKISNAEEAKNHDIPEGKDSVSDNNAGEGVRFSLGIGCKKGKEAEAIETLVEKVLTEAGIGINEIFAVGTIDIKAEEPGLLEFTKKHNLPLITFEAAMLAKAKGSFSHSGFVKETTGVDNVCERAAVLAAGPNGKLVIHKTAENGVTVAVAEK